MEVAALIISGISMIIAVVSFILSTKSQHLQNRVNEVEIKLKQYELEEKEQQKSSCVQARIIHVSKNSYKMKIWNSGNSNAMNVTASWDNNSVIVLNSDKMPFEVLEPQKSFDLSIATYNGMPGKVKIITEWEDEDGVFNKKEQWCDM